MSNPPPLQPLPGDPNGYPGGGYFPGTTGAAGNQPVDYRAGSIATARTSISAIVSLVLGILGCIPWLTGIAAILTGIVGIRATRDHYVRGRGMAIAGLLLGMISVGLWTLAGGFGAWEFVASAPARALSHQFIADLAAGNIPAATAESTANLTQPQLQAVATLMQGWGTLGNVRVNTVQVDSNAGNNQCFTWGTLITTQGSNVCVHTFQIHSVEQNGIWKVDNCFVQ
jgi:hypothetical protein